MANTKISALTSASTPLAGTEVLPIVQSGATVKVANNDLRPKQIQSNATSGVLQITGPAAASTRVATVPNANFTVARTDAAQSFTGDQTLSTGNLVVSNGKGVDFSATPGTGTSELFADYEEGTWTGVVQGTTSGTAAGYYVNTCEYRKVGSLVTVTGFVVISGVGTMVGGVQIAGLPFTSKNVTYLNSAGCIGLFTTDVTVFAGAGLNAQVLLSLEPNSTAINVRKQINGTSSVLGVSGILDISFTLSYFV